MTPIIKINAREVVKEFGGISIVIEKFSPYKKITRGGIEKWRERNSIPSDALLLFAVIAKKEKRNFDVTKFVFWT